MLIEDIIQSVITQWNSQVKTMGTNAEYVLETKCRIKTFFLNKKDSYEQRIAELSLYYRGEENFLLYRKELRMPDKVKGMPQHKLEQSMITDLYKFFLYDAIGNFGLTTKQLIKNKDYAEYDIVKDRMKANEEFEGMVVKTITKGAFYEEGDEFDVFQQGDSSWHVYTAHEIGRPNSGIAPIPGKDCKVIVQKKIKLDLV